MGLTGHGASVLQLYDERRAEMVRRGEAGSRIGEGESHTGSPLSPIQDLCRSTRVSWR
jgi:hypothetical protein